MGISCSHFQPNHEISGQSRSVLVTANALGYSNADVNAMYRLFSSMEYDGTGAISIDDYIRRCEIKVSTFATIAFSAFDSERTGEINFEEFLVCNWNLLTCMDLSLAKLVFHLFDTEKSGELAIIEIHELLGIICGGNSDVMHHLNVELDSLDLSKDEDVTFDQFFSFVRRTPLLLFPAYSTRDKCRKETLGLARWLEIGRRKSIEFGEYSITDILGSMRHRPPCYMEKIFSYENTGTIIRSTAAKEAALKNVQKRLTEKKNIRKNKSVDLRFTDSYLRDHTQCVELGSAQRKSSRPRTSISMSNSWEQEDRWRDGQMERGRERRDSWRDK